MDKTDKTRIKLDKKLVKVDKTVKRANRKGKEGKGKERKIVSNAAFFCRLNPSFSQKTVRNLYSKTQKRARTKRTLTPPYSYTI